MSVLPAQTIRKRGIFNPFHERTVHKGMTYGLGPAGYDIRIQQRIRLAKGGFALASSVEHFTMPNDLLGMVMDKSTWARLGLSLKNTVIEPGWQGYLTLELSAHDMPLSIDAGMPIAQIVFLLLYEATESPYDGKYQNQPALPVPAVHEVSSMPPVRLPAQAWLLYPEFKGIKVIDPDGWDRNNFDNSWAQPITREEFLRRLSLSTCQYPPRE